MVIDILWFTRQYSGAAIFITFFVKILREHATATIDKNLYRLLLLPSGALVIDILHPTQQYSGAVRSIMVFAKSLREHASATIDGKLHTKTLPPSLGELASAAIGGNNTKYDMLTPAHRVTKPNKWMVPSFTWALSPLQTYV
jgi:hypothetical protein